MPRTRAPRNVTPPEGCWIRYQLNLRNIKLQNVALKAGRAESTVSQVICGIKNSERIGQALADLLGYPSFEALTAAAAAQTKGGAA
jgi:hypothetical protein